MSDTQYLTQVVIVLSTAVAVSYLFRVMRLPSVVGFLITGVAIGPSAWHLIPLEGVQHFSELGLILLLFTVGLELSPGPLFRAGRHLLIAAGLQVGGTMLLTIAVLHALTSLGLAAEALIGLGVALSSTAIVLKQMSDHDETTSTSGLITTGLLLLQDVLVIVVLLAVSLLSAREGASWQGTAARGVGGLVGLAVLVLAARRFLPRILAAISRHGGRELLSLFAVMMASGGAWLAGLAGWSPALGACIAGLLLAGADERHQLVAEVTPFRDLFSALFFIALGMSVKLPVVFGHLPLVALATLATLALKSIVTAGAVRGGGWPIRIGLQVGIGLGTVSEFSYVLALQGNQLGLLTEEALDIVVAYAVGTMILGALLYPLGNPVAVWVSARLYGRQPSPGEASEEASAPDMTNHVVIVGYGTTGANLARMLRATYVPHCIVEMNQTLVQRAREDDEEVIVGDATRMSILAHAGIDVASVLVVAVNDKQATQRIVAQVRSRRPDLYLLARTNFVSDIDALYQRGATLVIPEDLETSIEVAAHVLRKHGIPDNIIEAQIAAVRTGGYAMLRGKPTTRAANAELIKILERTTTQTFYLADDSCACGVTIGRLNLRAITGCAIIAVVRSGEPTPSPGPEFQLEANDVLVLVGGHPQIEAAKAVLQRRELPETPDAPSAQATA